jgi:hypothetical protein
MVGDIIADSRATSLGILMGSLPDAETQVEVAAFAANAGCGLGRSVSGRNFSPVSGAK